MESKYFKILVVVIFMIFGGNTIVMAQSDGPPKPPDGRNDNNKLGAVPISGGVFILLGIGLAYGGRKLKIMDEK